MKNYNCYYSGKFCFQSRIDSFLKYFFLFLSDKINLSRKIREKFEGANNHVEKKRKIVWMVVTRPLFGMWCGRSCLLSIRFAISKHCTSCIIVCHILISFQTIWVNEHSLIISPFCMLYQTLNSSGLSECFWLELLNWSCASLFNLILNYIVNPFVKYISILL